MAAVAAVIVSYTYTYAQVAILRWIPGDEVWPGGGLARGSRALASGGGPGSAGHGA